MCLQIHAGVQWTPDLGYPSQQTERKMMQRTRRKIDAAPKAKIAPEALWGTGDGGRSAPRYQVRPIQPSTRAQIANFDILIPLS